MMEEDIYWLWLCGMEDMTRRVIYKLLKYFGTPQSIYRAKEEEIMPYLPNALKDRWKQNQTLDWVKKLDEELEKKHIRFIHAGQRTYPEQFKNINDAPVGLFVKGRLPEAGTKNIAIIGSRKASFYGREVAAYFAKELVKHGIGVISGLACGIDGAAHRGAIENNGYTLGFIGGGIYSVYPKENYDLYMQMEQTGGIASEYPPDTPPLGRLFPERNRLISGISDGIIVVEAKQKSGTFITVDQGLEQGKNVYAVPGRITDANSVGCIRLIIDGARPVLSVDDILQDLNIAKRNNDNFINNTELTENSLAQSEKKVYSCLSLDPMYIDEIIAQTGLSVSVALSVLLGLELKGLVTEIVKNNYIKK